MSATTFINPLHIVTRQEVDSPESFAMFVQQKLGTPYPTMKEMNILRKYLKEFFTTYPDLNYSVLVKIVDWCKAKKRRPAHSYQVITYLRYAWRDGAIPDLDPDQRKTVAGIR